ncbi:MAG: hypothetical protein ACI9VM_000388 [Candidatus Azotimanducaceae bacterium]|jgi:hypothetical protein
MKGDCGRTSKEVPGVAGNGIWNSISHDGAQSQVPVRPPCQVPVRPPWTVTWTTASDEEKKNHRPMLCLN